MKKTILLGSRKAGALVLILALGLATEVANADFTFGTPTNLGPTVNSSAFEGSPDISKDGLLLFFDAYFRPGAPGDWDIWVATRDATNGHWGAAVPLPPPINSSYADAGPTISADGLSLFFASDRPGGYGDFDLWVTTRKTTEDPWEPPVNLGPLVNSSASENHPGISADGLSLYFDSNWAFWFDYDICVVTRASINDDWGIPVWLGPATDWGIYDWSPSISSDGLTLFFEGRSQLGDRELLVARRRTTDDDWESLVNLGPFVNTTYDDCDPSISSDGYTLYFCSSRLGGVGNRDLWQVPIIPIVDLNGDGKVDLGDFCKLARYRGQDESSVDIAPGPFGDWMIDFKDLAVLAAHWLADFRLIAYWKLDEMEGTIAQDSIGENDGTLYGEPLWQPAVGKIAGALQFDGIDDYISTDLPLNPADFSFSIFAWVKGGAPGHVIISQMNYIVGQTAQPGSTWLGTDSSDGKLITRLMDVPYGPLESETVITNGQWHHVGVVYDFDGFCRRLYADGAEVAKDEIVVAGLLSRGSLRFSADKDLSAGSFFSGLIDDVRFYNVALSAKEIEELER